ncbi:S41 family peptidase [Patescibacteria group bacterium]|nr:S41 family peptidase [Patescibacteria group bacterium]
MGKKELFRQLVSIIGIGLLLGSFYLLGFTKGYYQRVNASTFSTVFKQKLSASESTLPDFALYETVLDILKDKYYEDVNYLDLLYGSIKGGVYSLNDPYTSFSTPVENKEFFTSLNGLYEGVGIEIDLIDDRVLVVAPLEGSPADAAGLAPKDEILAIDGRIVSGLDLGEVLSLIKGPKGSSVVLTIVRGKDDPKDITIVRDVVKIKSVQLKFEDEVAILKITKFGSDTEKLFNRAVTQILQNDSKGILLDLRNNPGGFLDTGVKVANEFLPGGLIVEERFKDGSVTPFSADGNGKLAKIPVVILVDGGSASAAEIVAGALRDNERAKIVGEHTYGKGSVQEIEEFPDGSALRITIAHWYTPGGVSISDGGLNPDIVIKGDGNGAEDSQLQRAIAELKKVIGE